MTTTRRGWRAALDSSLLLAVVLCGGASALLAAAPAAVVAGPARTVASIGSGATLVALGPDRGVVDKGAPASCGVVVVTRAVTRQSSSWCSTPSEGTPRDSAEDDDNEALQHSLSAALALGGETGQLTHLGLDPSVSLESDGHSLRAPP